MDCRSAKELLSAYLDGVLNEPTKSQLKSHLARCPICTTELAELEKTINTLKDLPQIKSPDDFLDKVNERIRQENEFEKIVRTYSPKKTRLPLEVAGVLVSVFFVVVIYKTIETRFSTSGYKGVVSEPKKVRRLISDSDVQTLRVSGTGGSVQDKSMLGGFEARDAVRGVSGQKEPQSFLGSKGALLEQKETPKRVVSTPDIYAGSLGKANENALRADSSLEPEGAKEKIKVGADIQLYDSRLGIKDSSKTLTQGAYGTAQESKEALLVLLQKDPTQEDTVDKIKGIIIAGGGSILSLDSGKDQEILVFEISKDKFYPALTKMLEFTYTKEPFLQASLDSYTSSVIRIRLEIFKK